MSKEVDPRASSSKKKGDHEGTAIGFDSVVNAKMMARRARRRKSLFEPEKVVHDLGTSTLSHADFPIVNPKPANDNKATEITGFDKKVIFEILKEVLDQGFEGLTYEQRDTARLCHEIARTLKERLALLHISEFKLVCTCYDTRRAKPCMQIESGCAWDELHCSIDKDGFVEYVFQNEELAVVGTVYGVHCGRKAPVKSKPILRKQRSFSLTD
ncbi:uncharacterized protein LOC5517148 [Nematostella vectensis]|uniref:uncharacterized protein LOC5517148 n=1 Tax=Nematostella vectensis TaxID=45351 RepID=UPI00207797F4|nr:uncharacterized protein LOC5517148 [Nematostella vectensis]XP_048585276.1 uncharacterized protein LOC5517148 [Nematostella vectensis]XP_048585279.1 uncharacterized protein LOC5517148 [Nematostella vectensis]